MDSDLLLASHESMKMGKLPARYDPRTLRLEDYLKGDLPPVPPSEDWTRFQTKWDMFLNDRISCCAIASPGHMIQTWTANAGKEALINDADILTGYRAVSGYVPGRPDTDVGCNMLDVNNYLVQTGIAGHRIAAYAKINAKDPDLISKCIYYWGGVSAGVALPAAWKGQSLWDVGPNLRGSWAPYSWGGHAVPGLAYLLGSGSAGRVTLVTWGMTLPMTFAALATYCDELYVYFSYDWFNGKKQAPNNLDLWALAKDFEQATGRPIADLPPRPDPTPPPVPNPPPPTPINPPGGGGMNAWQIMMWIVNFIQSPAGQNLVNLVEQLYQWIIAQKPQNAVDCEAAVRTFKVMKAIP